MKKLIIASALAVILVAPVSSQAGSSRLIDHQHASFTAPAGREITPTKVRDAIAAAGQTHGWVVTAEEPGKMTLSNTIRNTFKLVINVSYDVSGMTVDYVSSENLHYRTYHGVPYIHSKYNKWVGLLTQGVQARLSY